MRQDILNRKEEIEIWIQQNKSKAFICVQLDCQTATLESSLKKLNIVYKGNQGLKGLKISNKRKHALELVKRMGVGSHLLKLRLLEDKVFERCCDLCKKTKWMKNPIPLELHHKDGNHWNNEIENLQILCPNCHAQMPNNSGKGSRKNKPS